MCMHGNMLCSTKSQSSFAPIDFKSPLSDNSKSQWFMGVTCANHTNTIGNGPHHKECFYNDILPISLKPLWDAATQWQITRSHAIFDSLTFKHSEQIQHFSHYQPLTSTTTHADSTTPHETFNYTLSPSNLISTSNNNPTSNTPHCNTPSQQCNHEMHGIDTTTPRSNHYMTSSAYNTQTTLPHRNASRYQKKQRNNTSKLCSDNLHNIHHLWYTLNCPCYRLLTNTHTNHWHTFHHNRITSTPNISGSKDCTNLNHMHTQITIDYFTHCNLCPLILPARNVIPTIDPHHS